MEINADAEGKSDRLRVLTWNINGLKPAPSRISPTHTLKNMLDALDADIIGMQEAKLTREMCDASVAMIPGYNAFFSFSRVKDGYSGVVTYCRSHIPVLAAEEGITGLLRPYHKNAGLKVKNEVEQRWNTLPTNVGPPYDLEELIRDEGFTMQELEDLDQEGRALITDHGAFVLVNVYVPNAASMERFNFKRRYLTVLKYRCLGLMRTGRPVILMGDMNCVSSRLDHCNPEHAEREWAREYGVESWEQHPIMKLFQSFITPVPPRKTLPNAEDEPDPMDAAEHSNPSSNGVVVTNTDKLVDLFRFLHPTLKGAFTCWNQRTFARQTNYGTRIDYIATDPCLLKAVMQCEHMPQQMGSDHCPMFVDLKRSALPIPLPPVPDTLPALCASQLPMFQVKQSTLLGFLARQPASTASDVSEQSAPAAPSVESTDSTGSTITSSQPVVSAQISDPVVGAKRAVSAIALPAKKPASKVAKKLEAPSGQKTLFSFMPKTSPAATSATPMETKSPLVSPRKTESESPPEAATQQTAIMIEDDARLAAELAREEENSPQLVSSETKAQWKGMLGGVVPPKCKGHNQPCRFRVSQTKENKGRPFWTCDRGVGEKGNKEAQCGHFEWADNRRDKPKTK